MKNRKHLIILIASLFLTVACSCGLIERLFSSGGDQVVVEGSDGSLTVDATAAAEAEFAMQTQMAEISATQQAILDRLEASAESISGSAIPTVVVDRSAYQTPVAPGVTSLSVSVDTNCRSGPGMGYQVVDGVFVGQTVEVLGKDASGAYYIVKSPQGVTCWVWSHYATVNGDVNMLTVMTPPPPDYGTIDSDWQDWLVIRPVSGFSWEGHWVLGAPGGLTYAEWYNNQAAGCAECWRIESMELDIVRSGDMLDIVMIQNSYWLDGSTMVHAIYGLAEVSPDNTIAVGLFYLEEVLEYPNGTDVGTTWAINAPILWYQSTSPDYFLGDSNQYAICGARSGSGVPIPCTWP